MKKLWKRDRKYYLFVVILIMIASFFAAEKVHTMMSKYVLSYYEYADRGTSKKLEYLDHEKVRESFELYNYRYFGVIETRYDVFYTPLNEKVEAEYEAVPFYEKAMLDRSPYDPYVELLDQGIESFINRIAEVYRQSLENEINLFHYELPDQGREVFRGKLVEAYQRSKVQAKVGNKENLTEAEEDSVKKIFEKKVNRVYAEVVGNTIEQEYFSRIEKYSIKFEDDVNGEDVKRYAYDDLIDEIYRTTLRYTMDPFGYEYNQEQFNYEFYAIIVFMIFVFIVQILKWKLFDNHEFELVLPIQKKTRVIYDLLMGVGLSSLPSLYLVIKGVVWQIHFKELGYFGAMNQHLLMYTLSRVSYIFVSCLVLYMFFYFFIQMSHSVVFASALYAVSGFPLILYALRNTVSGFLFTLFNLSNDGWNIAVIGGLVVSILMFVLNVWIGVKDEGSNTKLFKYKSFQVIVNLIMIVSLFCGLTFYGVFIMAGELLSSMVIFVVLLAFIALINLWVYRYDYKRANE